MTHDLSMRKLDRNSSSVMYVPPPTSFPNCYRIAYMDLVNNTLMP